MRIRVCVEGDLCRALVWEARLRGIHAEDLALSMIRQGSSRIMKSWRATHEEVSFLEPRPERSEGHTCESVLQEAYGPVRRVVKRVRIAEP